MPKTATQPKTILDDFLDHHARNRGRPVPLKETSYDVAIESGLAVVRATRLFRNDEKAVIEATMTFPAPFDGVVSSIRAKIGDRVLVGQAADKLKARASYEDAADRGKAAVLHEELLRGLHMISVANVAPGQEIEVTATIVMPLAFADDVGQIRIPLTVGQIYGESALPESDDIVTGGVSGFARIKVTSAFGTAVVKDLALDDLGGAGSVSLGRPIQISVVGAKTPALTGRAADGRQVEMTFSRRPAGAGTLDIDILLDVSGSMREHAESVYEGRPVSKWDVVRAGVVAASGTALDAADKVRLWAFSDRCEKAGEGSGDQLGDLIRTTPFFGQGTETALAVAKVVAARPEGNILLVTDGQSHRRPDVEAAVRRGARITVVLVGEDSLEVNVGYLAAVTGGQMFVASGAQADLAIVAALASMRDVMGVVAPVPATPVAVSRQIGGVDIAATWSKAGKSAPAREGVAAAVAAYAAHVAIAGMAQADASAFAAAEGIVSNGTSIVLVDEAGEAVDGLMANRKVALPSSDVSRAARLGAGAAHQLASPAGAGAMRLFASAAPGGALRSGKSLAASSFGSGAGFEWDDASASSLMGQPEEGDDSDLSKAIERARRRIFRKPKETALPAVPDLPKSSKALLDARALIGLIDWDADPQGLKDGLTHSQSPHVRTMIAELALLDEVLVLAKALGATPAAIAIAIVAKLEAENSRTAARIHRAVVGRADPAMLDTAMRAAGV